MNRTEYYIGFGGLPSMVIYTGKQVDVLTYKLETGEFVPGVTSLSTLYQSHDNIESISESEFHSYVEHLRELCHLDVPRYFIINKLPVMALPVAGRFPDVRKFNMGTDEFEGCLSYITLVNLSGEIGRVSKDEFDRCLVEIRDWYAHGQAPRYYLVQQKPVKIIRSEEGKLKLVEYDAEQDRFITFEWIWRSLIPPVDLEHTTELCEDEYQRQIKEKRNKRQKTAPD